MAARLPCSPGNRGAISTVPPLMGVCVKPLPRVVNVPPRVSWKARKGGMAAVPFVAPPPSQLISRRPLSSGPGLLALLGSPKAARKASTVGWIDAVVVFPPTENTIGTAPTVGGIHKRKADSAVPPYRERRIKSFIVIPLSALLISSAISKGKQESVFQPGKSKIKDNSGTI